MLRTKCQGYWLFTSEGKDFKGLFTIQGHIGVNPCYIKSLVFQLIFFIVNVTDQI